MRLLFSVFSLLSLLLFLEDAAALSSNAKGQRLLTAAAAPPPQPPSLSLLSSSASDASPASPSSLPPLDMFSKTSGLVNEGIVVAGLVYPPPRPNAATSSCCVYLELKSAEGELKDSKTVCLQGREPASYLLYSASSAAELAAPRACPAPMMLTATATTKANVKEFKKISSSSSPSWARALVPTGSAALIDVDWVGLEDSVDEGYDGSLVALIAAFAVGAAAAASAAALILLRKPRASPVAAAAAAAPTSSSSSSEADEEEKRNDNNREEQVRSRWAREKGGKGGGKGRLTKVVEAAGTFQSPSL